MEEIVRSFNEAIEDGKAFYWGTSEWSAAEVTHAILLCEKLNLIKPITEQPEYNFISRNKFEREYDYIFDRFHYGSTVWSPLAGGILTGKYNKGIPPGSRYDKM